MVRYNGFMQIHLRPNQTAFRSVNDPAFNIGKKATCEYFVESTLVVMVMEILPLLICACDFL